MASKRSVTHPFLTAALSILIPLLHNSHAQALAHNRTARRVPPAVIVFGDSVVDPGNNNENFITTARANYPPYGKDFVGHQATGRFSNGKIPSDFLASNLGVKEYVPAYLWTKLSDQDLLTGVSFASGGCGYDPLTARLVSALTLDDQLNLFREYKEKLKRIAGERARTIIAKAVYSIFTGTNDIATTYFLLQVRKVDFDLPSYIKFLVQCASGFFQELYGLGARRMSVMGLPPIGCVPAQRTLAGGIERECVTLYNQAAMMLNSALSTEVQRLKSVLPGSRIAYVDVYTPMLDMILRPSAYGFEESKRGCCGTGLIEVTMACNSLTTVTCENVSNFVFWDSFHPTERAYDILMRQMGQQNSSLLLQ